MNVAVGKGSLKKKDTNGKLPPVHFPFTPLATVPSSSSSSSSTTAPHRGSVSLGISGGSGGGGPPPSTKSSTLNKTRAASPSPSLSKARAPSPSSFTSSTRTNPVIVALKSSTKKATHVSSLPPHSSHATIPPSSSSNGARTNLVSPSISSLIVADRSRFKEEQAKHNRSESSSLHNSKSPSSLSGSFIPLSATLNLTSLLTSKEKSLEWVARSDERRRLHSSNHASAASNSMLHFSMPLTDTDRVTMTTICLNLISSLDLATEIQRIRITHRREARRQRFVPSGPNEQSSKSDGSGPSGPQHESLYFGPSEQVQLVMEWVQTIVWATEVDERRKRLESEEEEHRRRKAAAAVTMPSARERKRGGANMSIDMRGQMSMDMRGQLDLTSPSSASSFTIPAPLTFASTRAYSAPSSSFSPNSSTNNSQAPPAQPVVVDNFTSSFRSGVALCYIIRYYFPSLLRADEIVHPTMRRAAGTLVHNGVGADPSSSTHTPSASMSSLANMDGSSHHHHQRNGSSNGSMHKQHLSLNDLDSDPSGATSTELVPIYRSPRGASTDTWVGSFSCKSVFASSLPEARGSGSGSGMSPDFAASRRNISSVFACVKKLILDEAGGMMVTTTTSASANSPRSGSAGSASASQATSPTSAAITSSQSSLSSSILNLRSVFRSSQSVNPDERGIIALLAFVASRMIVLSREIHALKFIQRFARRYKNSRELRRGKRLEHAAARAKTLVVAVPVTPTITAPPSLAQRRSPSPTRGVELEDPTIARRLQLAARAGSNGSSANANAAIAHANAIAAGSPMSPSALFAITERKALAAAVAAGKRAALTNARTEQSKEFQQRYDAMLGDIHRAKAQSEEVSAAASAAAETARRRALRNEEEEEAKEAHRVDTDSFGRAASAALATATAALVAVRAASPSRGFKAASPRSAHVVANASIAAASVAAARVAAIVAASSVSRLAGFAASQHTHTPVVTPAQTTAQLTARAIEREWFDAIVPRTAISLQSLYRGKIGRRVARHLRSDRLAEERRWALEDSAVLTIQCAFRCHLARCRFRALLRVRGAHLLRGYITSQAILRQTQTLHAQNANDVARRGYASMMQREAAEQEYLESSREQLELEELEQETRERTKHSAALKIQCAFRSFIARMIVSELRSDKRLRDMHAAAIVIQSYARLFCGYYRHTQRVRVLDAAATTIQCLARSHSARRFVHRRRRFVRDTEVQRKKEEAAYAALALRVAQAEAARALQIQCAYRSYRSRAIVSELRFARSIRLHSAALVIQCSLRCMFARRVLRARKIAAAVLASQNRIALALKEQALAREEAARLAKVATEKARRAREVATHIARQNATAGVIQRGWRCHFARGVAQGLRERREVLGLIQSSSALSIQCFWRSHLAKRAAQGRRAEVIQDKIARIRAYKAQAVTTIACAWRCFLARELVQQMRVEHREAILSSFANHVFLNATTIQCAFRCSRALRRVAALRDQRDTRAEVDRLKEIQRAKRAENQAQYYNGATTIQCAYRCYVARRTRIIRAFAKKNAAIASVAQKKHEREIEVEIADAERRAENDRVRAVTTAAALQVVYAMRAARISEERHTAQEKDMLDQAARASDAVNNARTDAALSIQCFLRRSLAQARARLRRRAISTLQRVWRGRAVRLRTTPVSRKMKLKSIGGRLKLSMHATKDEQRIGHRLHAALQLLLTSSSLSSLLASMQVLSSLTALLPVCCLVARDAHAIPALYAVLAGLNRSAPHQQLFDTTLNILANLAGCRVTKKDVYETAVLPLDTAAVTGGSDASSSSSSNTSGRTGLDALIDSLTSYIAVPSVMLKVTRFISVGLASSSVAFNLEVRSAPNLKKLTGIQRLLARKLELETKVMTAIMMKRGGTVAAGANGSSSHRGHVRSNSGFASAFHNPPADAFVCNCHGVTLSSSLSTTSAAHDKVKHITTQCDHIDKLMEEVEMQE